MRSKSLDEGAEPRARARPLPRRRGANFAVPSSCLPTTASKGRHHPVPMSDCLLDEALQFCDATLLQMCDTAVRRQLRARLGLLERASWSLALLPATEEQVVHLAKLILALRDDVVRACASEAAQGPTTALAIASAVSSSDAPSMCLFHASTMSAAGAYRA